MFFHGIDYQHLLIQFPVLSPRLTILQQNHSQKEDRKHLLEQFGFEPVHFLESSKTYSVKKCLNACFNFGNVIFAFSSLPQPLLQLSPHEVGVPVVDTRKAKAIFIQNRELINKIKRLYPQIPVFIMVKKMFS
ncbi:hypothetical protein [Tepidibacillus fermentans]|uniref:Uncharacterized protein n=1 Tax=Tepidibacillus fermentans TaxID=1281767 RepID=A0A4R3KJD9_9BACI|nr:hypothetical protein [Tepidibacillus fermentans]TCS83494.1 hypothetical protein EDD72_10439 [Tepidibacillus fermentans]